TFYKRGRGHFMIDINKIIDLKTLQQIQDRFSEATGLAAIAVDINGNYITKGSNFTDFCMKYTRGSTEGLRRCVKCDNECTGTYYCHAGLMDFSSDLVINGEKVGAIIGGQVLPKPPDEEEFRKIARELGINESDYINALRQVPIKDEKSIHAAASLLADIVNMMINLKYIEAINQKKVEVFNAELSSVTVDINNIKSSTDDLENIASMENILSINAMIEASRAGQAGASFAIVAREMGELSKKSAGVYDKIQDFAQHVSDAVNRMNKVVL
ncbi:MAG TPA: PocR ligand-binding domain-containing protein, partial [Clostridia bacterium]|nr:PocR ligand-binding domain-containing protein [Clostridia bacterium]